jgi:hypothetical protein
VAEPQRHIGRDRGLTVDDPSDSVHWYVDLPRQFGGGNAEFLQLLGEMLAGRSVAVCSAEWVIDDYTFDLAPMAHILGEQLAAAERTSGSYNSRVPIGQPAYDLDLQCVDHDG